MRKVKGKWVASSKDVMWTGNSLSPIILAHITRLYEGMKQHDCVGVPMFYVEKQGEIQGLTGQKYWQNCDEVDLEAAHKLRLADLEELMFVFNTENEPDIQDYDFHCEFVPNEEGGLVGKIEISNLEESDRYTKDMREYEERVDKGYALFGQVYRELDW